MWRINFIPSNMAVKVVAVRYTIEARIKEPAFIRNSRLKFQPLSHLNRNHREAEQG